VMMMMMPLLAVALAIPPKRSTSALGVFVSIIMVVAYHKVNQYGEDVASLGRLDPMLAFWVPFALFAGLIVWMFYRVAYVPGGQAIGALEMAFAKLSKRIGKLFSRRAPRAYHPATPEAAPAE
jgi:lipopolysaccharide export system permease protein